ncbi:hypothetical protein [Tsukamurella spumae]|uniref:Uncharacterized protein n=1 Tax=Tsukamurella spumae TaxID=44753 RepID=A0A846X2R9_9ACTN|nr:hypothetical protein [Tsukamurella spumae]NKY19453.1 hypothetical protein [Tsukamurella spumae]
MTTALHALAAEAVGRGLPVNLSLSPLPSLLIGHGRGIITVIATATTWEATATYNAWTRPITGRDLVGAVTAHLDAHTGTGASRKGITGPWIGAAA